MGAGKSTVGRLLANWSGRYFLDADVLIESACGRDVKSIFQKEGEAHFRLLERETAHWLARCVRGSVVSTGGGMPTVVERLREIGTVVYLQLPFEAIVARMDSHEQRKRPLFQDLDAAHRLFREREAMYESQADFIVDATLSPEEIARTILNRAGAAG